MSEYRTIDRINRIKNGVLDVFDDVNNDARQLVAHIGESLRLARLEKQRVRIAGFSRLANALLISGNSGDKLHWSRDDDMSYLSYQRLDAGDQWIYGYYANGLHVEDSFLDRRHDGWTNTAYSHWRKEYDADTGDWIRSICYPSSGMSELSVVESRRALQALADELENTDFSLMNTSPEPVDFNT